MLLCLSSAAKPRYRHDILRALAMPTGSRLPFRYDFKYVENSLHDELKRNGIKGRSACIAYLDADPAVAAPVIYPIRSAKVVSTVPEGDFCTVTLELRGLAYSERLVELDAELRTQCTTLPTFTGQGAEVTGHFCVNLAKKPRNLMFGNDMGKWQSLCAELAKFKEYAQEPVFYRLDSLQQVGSDMRARLHAGTVYLKSGKLYDVNLVHFSSHLTLGPQPKNKELNWVVVDADDKVMTPVVSKALAIDSKYDLKVVRVRTPVATLQTLDGRMSLSRRLAGADKAEDAIWDFDVPVRVGPNWPRLLVEGVLIGVPVVAQALVLAYKDDIGSKPLVAVLVTIAGLAAGLAASFGLRKA